MKQNSCNFPRSFLLSDDMKFEIEWADGIDPGSLNSWFFFQEATHTIPAGRPSYVLLCGARVIFEPFQVPESPKSCIIFGAGCAEMSSDGFELTVSFRECGEQQDRVFLEDDQREFIPTAPWRERELVLDQHVGKVGQLVVECFPGPENEPAGDWLALYELVVSSKSEFNLQRARAFMAFKEKNEIAIFTDTYTHKMYNE